MIYQIVALVLVPFIAIALQGWIFSRFVLSRLDYGCTFSVRESHEGDEIYLVETVVNGKILPVPWLKVDIHSSRWLEFAGTISVVNQESRRVTSSFLLKGNQKVTRRWRLKCIKRGVFTIGNVTLLSGDALGRQTTSAAVPVNAELVVYPEIIDLDEMFVPINHVQGDTIVRRWIVDDPFVVAGIREYTATDSMNRIHWQATAKEGRLMVKKNDFTSRTSLMVLLNIQSIENEYDEVVCKDVIELGIKAAATIFDRSLRNGMPAGFGTNGCTLEGGRNTIFTEQASGKEHIGELLNILARLQLKNLRDFEIFLKEKVQNIKNSDILVITAYFNSEMCRLLRELRAGGNMVKVIIIDPGADITDLPGDIEIYIRNDVGVGEKQ